MTRRRINLNDQHLTTCDQLERQQSFYQGKCDSQVQRERNLI